jgi:hypothetical protein
MDESFAQFLIPCRRGRLLSEGCTVIAAVVKNKEIIFSNQQGEF